MERKKLITTADDMKAETLRDGGSAAYAVSGTSMLDFIRPGDRILIKKTEIKPGDVVVFRRDNKKIVHRVISMRRTNNSTVFRTGGDNVFNADSFTVGYDDIMGKVTGLIRNGRKRDFNKISGKLIFLKYLLVSKGKRLVRNIKKHTKEAINNFMAVAYLEKDFSCDYDFRQSYIELCGDNNCCFDDRSSDLFSQEHLNNNHKIYEVCFGMGFSQTGLELIRRGVSVERVETEELEKCGLCDTLVVSDMYSLIFGKRARKEFMQSLCEILNEKGRVFLCRVKKRKTDVFGAVISIKRKILKVFFTGIPEPGDNVIFGKFKYHEFYFKELASEAAKSGFSFNKVLVSADCFNLVLEKK